MYNTCVHIRTQHSQHGRMKGVGCLLMPTSAHHSNTHLEHVDGLPLHDGNCKFVRSHVWPPPGAVDSEEAKASE